MFKTSWQMGTTLHERRFGEPLKGPGIPFGSMVEYHPFFSAKDQSRLLQFGEKVSLVTLLGHALFAGRIWKGDLMVADIEELEKSDPSEIHARSLNANSRSQMEQSTCLEQIRLSENPPPSRMTLNETKSNDDLRRESDGSNHETR